MIHDPRIVRESAYRVATAAERTTVTLRSGGVQQEPAFTDRMLGRIEEAMNGFEVKGVRWSAMTLTDRGRGSQESIYGADFMGVLDIAIPGFSVTKGFLAQAKYIEPTDSVSQNEPNLLTEQCEKMLSISPASFVFLYGAGGIKVVPAISVLGLDARTNPNELYNRSSQRFFEEHFECFIGDRKLHTANIQTLNDLKRLADVADARNAVFLQARTAARKK